MECAAKYAHLLADISAERKCDELKKILLSDIKYSSIKRDEPPQGTGLRLLRTIGALAYILPRLCDGDGISQTERYHAHDVLGHGIAACAAAPPVWPVRLAALLHDIGKPEALIQSGNMHGHEKLGAALAEEEMGALKVDKQTRSMVTVLIRHHMFDSGRGAQNPRQYARQAVILGRDVFEMLIKLRRADFIGSGKECEPIRSADNWQAELDRMDAAHVPWVITDLNISGDDIMHKLCIGASPAVGRILTALHAECVMHPAMNKRDILLHRVKKLAPLILP